MGQAGNDPRALPGRARGADAAGPAPHRGRRRRRHGCRACRVAQPVSVLRQGAGRPARRALRGPRGLGARRDANREPRDGVLRRRGGGGPGAFRPDRGHLPPGGRRVAASVADSRPDGSRPARPGLCRGHRRPVRHPARAGGRSLSIEPRFGRSGQAAAREGGVARAGCGHRGQARAPPATQGARPRGDGGDPAACSRSGPVPVDRGAEARGAGDRDRPRSPRITSRTPVRGPI